MSFRILDTDHVSAALRGNQSVINRAAQQHPNVVITIITVQERFNGWMGKINQTSDTRKLVNLYSKLTQTIDLIKAVQVLNFDNSADQVYQSLRQQFPVLARKRIGKSPENRVYLPRPKRHFGYSKHPRLRAYSQPHLRKLV